MNRGARTVRCMVAIAVYGLASAAAVAGKLDNAACSALTDERNAITATGVKEEMERGPEWAKANMPPERLQSALRLLEVEDQLEFRCARRGKPSKSEQTASPAKPPAPASDTPSAAVKNSAQDSAQDSTKAAEQPPPRVAPAAPDQKSTSAPSMPAPTLQPPVAQKPAHVVPAPPAQRTSTAAPGSAPSSPLVSPVKAPAVGAATIPPSGPAAPATSAVNTPTQPAPAVAVTPPPVTPPVTQAAPNQQAIAVPIGPTPGGPASPGVAPEAKSPKAAARKKRNPSSAYVSPNEVSPFSLPGMR